MVFTKDWFVKHQLKLLWFANTKLGRWFFKIHKDCPKDKLIVCMFPNSYTWYNDDGTYTTDFRTHDKFAKRLYYGLKPLWYIFHCWDKVFANNLQPAWNVGFDTLTTYPASGANSPCDGMVLRDPTPAESFSTIRSASGTDAVTPYSVVELALYCSATTNSYIRLSRDIFLFDTSSIGGTATINSASFSIACSLKLNAIPLTDAHAAIGVVSTNPASTSTLQSSDYDITNWGSTRFANDILYSNINADGSTYNDFNFNGDGLSAIDKTGITKLGIRLAVDIDNGSPAWSTNNNTYYTVLAAEQTGTSKDPKLVVNYTLESPLPSGNKKIMVGTPCVHFNRLHRVTEY